MEAATNLVSALDYLKDVVIGRLKVHLGQSEKESVLAPSFRQDASLFTEFLNRYKPSFEEYITFLLALAPHLQPDFFNTITEKHLPNGGDFPAFGGVKGQNHRGILPTGETVQFILAGNNLAKRLEAQQLFSSGHWFARKGILWLEQVPEGEPIMSGRLALDPEWVERITTGKVSPPPFNNRFPAEHLHTELDWDDLVLPEVTYSQIREIETWVKHHHTLMEDWGMKRVLKPGYRALFHGPPGTGKTLTATLLGKFTGREVFRVDLSLVVSKFIGETEKNLASLFRKATNKDWILFFDEADALFGKRTDVRDAHDKYANQEVSYLLQRIESYPGLVILASNFRSNVDEAFTRRFQALVYFPVPRAPERLLLWQKAFPAQIQLGPDIDLQKIAHKYELTGSNIINIVQYASLELLSKGALVLNEEDLVSAIQREYAKEDKII